MSHSVCNCMVDDNHKELAKHGTPFFPIACYHDTLRKDSVPWHWHEELEAVIIAEGSCIVTFGNQKYIVHAGEGFFINSEILHGCWKHNHSSCHFHSMVFHPNLVGGNLGSVFYQNYILPFIQDFSVEGIIFKSDVPWKTEALHLLEQTWQSCSTASFGYEIKVRNYLSDFILLLQQNLSNTTVSPNAKSLHNRQRIKTMLQYIHDHYIESITMEQIAQSASISKSECLRCFRKTIDVTPIQYVRQYRIKQAAKRLVTTEDSVSQIAEQCGFSDLSYFTKTFREITGVPPLQYRTKSS